MLKHIGTHGNRKIVVLFRTIPSEEHMCLVVYSDLLPRIIHDEVMKTLESSVGQQAENLADALFRQIMPDGRNCLEVLHKEGLMTKVQTNQVIMTPNNASKIRLDELNNYLEELKKGDEAIKRLEELDKNSGMTSKYVNEMRNNQAANATATATAEPLQASETGVLTDEQIAQSQRSQAAKLRQDAEQLIAEAARLEQEAQALAPTKTTKTTKAKTTTKTTVAKAPAKRATKNDSAKETKV